MRQIAILVVFTAASAPLSQAAFRNASETFDGTQLDSTAWQPVAYPTDPTSPFSQNDALTIDGTGVSRDAFYTTREQRIGVGEGVQVDVRMNAYTDHGPAYTTAIFVALTTNDQTGVWIIPTTASSSFWFEDSPPIGIDCIVARGNTGTGTTIPGFVKGAQPEGSVYTYRIERLTELSARFSVFDAMGHLLGEYTRTDLAGIPSDLFVSLGVMSASATFDNVRIIPDPSMAVPTGALVLLLRCRQQRVP